MNNDNEANDVNDNDNELYVGLPETERQELLRRRREVQQEIQMLRQERENQFASWEFFSVMSAKNTSLQQQAELVEEDTEEDTDTVSSSMVEPNP
jgi:hypothetical protein